MQNTCADCGRPSHGYRCNKCHGKLERQRGLDASEKRDREILAMMPISGARLAARLGVSPARAGQLLKKVRAREELREKVETRG